MHIVPRVPRAVTLFGRDGSVQRFASLRKALSALGFSWIRENVARNFREHDPAATARSPTGEPVCRESPFVMRDDFGEPLVARDFEPLLPPRPAYQPGFMGGKWAASAGHLRYPRRFAELRDAAGWREEGEPDGRPRRRWDYPRCICYLSMPACHGEPSWKRHSRRPRQWRALRE